MARKQVYAWLRLDAETPQAYEAFRTYLDMGTDRSLRKVMAELSKSHMVITDWSRDHRWVERVREFDRHIAMADTDGFINQLSVSRDKNLALVDKLRDHLSTRLDTFIQTKQDPTVRWTQALLGMAKLEQNSFMLKDDAKTSERVGRLEELLEEALELRNSVEER